MLRHLEASPSPETDHLSRKALVVDVFHHKNKHKKNDVHCAFRCNPALYPDLRVGNKWRFNSSACEQQNRWIVKFAGILHEMREERYNFLLDEVMDIRNEKRYVELFEKNKCPYNL